MKGYINKRAKIKYETTPTAPDLTNDHIKEVVGEMGIGDLEDIEISDIVAQGSILRAQSVGTDPKWKPAQLALRYKPIATRDVTADGNTDSYTIDIMDTADMFAYKSLGVMFDLSLNAGSEQTALSVEVSVNGADFVSVGSMTNAVPTSGALKSKVYGIQLIGAFMTFFGSPTISGVHSIQTRYDGIVLNSNTVKYVRFKLANAANFPEGSTIKLTLIQWDF